MAKTPDNSRSERRRGFTLVELLSALAIAAVLLAVLMPVIVQARNRARTVACLTNLRQLGVALAAYSDDWQGRLPRLSGTPFRASLPDARWPDASSATHLRRALAGYVKDEAILRCGNDLGAPEFGFATEQGSVFARAGSSYVPWSNARTGLYGLPVNGGKAGALEPSQEHVLLRDYGSGWHGYRSRVGVDLTSTNVANCVFADGHAAAVPVFGLLISDRHYAYLATNPQSEQGLAYLCGASGDFRVLLSGRRRIVDGAKGAEISLSGTVVSGGVDYSVDRVFRFSSDTRLEPALRQIVNWVDSLVAN